MSMQSFLMRKMLESKLKDTPESEKQKIFELIEKNPDFFQKIAIEVQNEMKTGKDQMSATMSVVKKYEGELKGLL